MPVTDKYTILVSAPKGSLGRHLATLIDYAVNNTASVPDFSAQIRKDLEKDQFVFPESSARSPVEFYTSDWDANSRTTVMYSALAPAQLRDLYPNSSIVHLTSNRDDLLQRAYNYVVCEIWQSAGPVPSLTERYAEQYETIIGQPFDFGILENPQAFSEPELQTLISLVASSGDMRSESAVEADHYLALAFGEYCKPAGRAEDNAPAIDTLLDFLEPNVVRDRDQLKSIWQAQTMRLHQAKQTLINTANRSN